MADEAKLGKPWQAEELDAIVRDYFAMLADETDGTGCIKSDHSKALMAQIGRTHKSIEFKHQNISAVLDELGLPWIPGYMPKRNYQLAIIDAVDRFLSQSTKPFEAIKIQPPLPMIATDILVATPGIAPIDVEPSPRLRCLIQKFDPVQRDFRNRALGKAGEAFVLAFERSQLESAGQPDLAKQVRWVADQDGDGAGYDVLSFDAQGRKRFLEVKTTNGSARTPFYLTRNECDFAQEQPGAWSLYRVHLFSSRPKIFTISPPLERHVNLQPQIWRAAF